jgi:hypothetical protein
LKFTEFNIHLVQLENQKSQQMIKWRFMSTKSRHFRNVFNLNIGCEKQKNRSSLQF